MDSTHSAICSLLSKNAVSWLQNCASKAFSCATEGDGIFELENGAHLLGFAALRVPGQHSLIQQQGHCQAGLVKFCWCCALAALPVGMRQPHLQRRNNFSNTLPNIPPTRIFG